MYCPQPSAEFAAALERLPPAVRGRVEGVLNQGCGGVALDHVRVRITPATGCGETAVCIWGDGYSCNIQA